MNQLCMKTRRRRKISTASISYPSFDWSDLRRCKVWYGDSEGGDWHDVVHLDELHLVWVRPQVGWLLLLVTSASSGPTTPSHLLGGLALAEFLILPLLSQTLDVPPKIRCLLCLLKV